MSVEKGGVQGAKDYRRILDVNIMSQVFPYGDRFPADAPPFYGVRNTAEIPAIPDPGSRDLVTSMVKLCQRLQQRAIPLAREGDVVPVETHVDPDLVQHVLGDSLRIDPRQVTFLPVQDTGKMTLPEAILADGKLMDKLRGFVGGKGERWIVSPFAVDQGSRDLAKELGTGYGQEWPHAPQQMEPTGTKLWRFPQEERKWDIVDENSKARNYKTAQEIDPDWVPAGGIEPTYEDAGFRVARMLGYADYENGKPVDQVVVKADINVDGLGNLRFAKTEDGLRVKYEDHEEVIPVERPDEVVNVVKAKCEQFGIYVNEDHPAVVQEWEKFFLGLTPSTEVYIPPLESGVEPFIMNECVQLIKDGSFVGSINPDPLAVTLGRLAEVPDEYWENLGMSRQEFTRNYRAQYLAAWEKQRQLSIAFAKQKQEAGEVGHRDFDFGIVEKPDGTMVPRKCESNARRTGTWVADTVGRRVLGNNYMDDGYVLTVDNMASPVFDDEFRNVHRTFVNRGGIFVPEQQSGIILTGHIRNGDSSRVLTTVVGKGMTEVWNNYHLAQEVMKGN